MANRTAKDAKTIHGTNPQYLVEKIIRTRIYESRYWKEECFGLSAADVLEKGMALRFIGGIYGGNIKPSPFLCLTLKMLQIQPDKDIIIAFIGKFGEKLKYVRALGAYYLRLTASSLDNWKYLEPLYNDFRKLRMMDRMGNFSVIHVDEFVDMLLREERVFDVILPRISKRRVHEDANELDPRISVLEQDLGEEESGEDLSSDEGDKAKPSTSSSKGKEESKSKKSSSDDKKKREDKRKSHREKRDSSSSSSDDDGRYRRHRRSPSPERRRRHDSRSPDRRRDRRTPSPRIRPSPTLERRRRTPSPRRHRRRSDSRSPARRERRRDRSHERHDRRKRERS